MGNFVEFITKLRGFVEILLVAVGIEQFLNQIDVGCFDHSVSCFAAQQFQC